MGRLGDVLGKSKKFAIVAYIATDIINIYIAELTLNSNGANEILGIVKLYLPKGKLGKAIEILFFVIVSIVMLHDLIISNIVNKKIKIMV